MNILENYDILNKFWIKFVEMLHLSLSELLIKNIRETFREVFGDLSGYLIKLRVILDQILCKFKINSILI